MKKSEHNILVKLRADAWLLANPLSGQADLLSDSEAAAFENNTFEDVEELRARGYLVDPDEEAAAYDAAYLRFLKEREDEEVQLFYVPAYACNFSCSYCYQDQYPSKPPEDDGVLDAFFDYVDKTFAGRAKYLTLFGGEPLLPGKKHRDGIARFLALAKARGLETAVVTNGYHIADYVDLLENALIREVQVTLDGVREGHDRRRFLKHGGGTFERIVAGVDQLLGLGIPVNLRLVLDRDNIAELPRLADFAIERGWVDNPAFKTQLGRNYALHHCPRDPEKLFDRLEMYREIAAMAAAHPTLLRFHKPAFHLAKILSESGVLPSPNFDACPGAKTEWAFDYTGRIYSCTATVGKEGAALGTFYPTVRLDEDAIFAWQDRDVLAIEACRACHVRLVCGGGCGALAENRTGSVNSADCRPIAEITALGAALYLRE